MFSLAISHGLNVTFQLDCDEVAMTNRDACEEGPAYNDKNSKFIIGYLGTILKCTLQTLKR